MSSDFSTISDKTESKSVENIVEKRKRECSPSKEDIFNKRFRSESDSANDEKSKEIGGDVLEDGDSVNKNFTKQTLKKEFKTYTKEKDVGITEFIGNHKRFLGLIKERYSDFIVNEINQNDEVVRLTSFDVPVEKQTHVDINSVLKEKIIEELKDLSQEGNNEVVIQVTNHTKEERQKIHEAIKQNFCYLKSSTEERDSGKVIIVTIASKKDKQVRRQDWPSKRGNFTQFVLYKENTDTMEAVNTIANCLGLKSKLFTYAGVKDKRAKTSQLVSIYRISAERLKNLNERLKKIKLGNFQYCNDTLRLGDLKGNAFNIVIRDIKGSDEEINIALQSLRDKGFINYYGLQRFGTTSVGTHMIGRSLLLGKWEEAIELILKPRENENDPMKECRRYWMKTRDAAGAFNKLECKNSIEGYLLKGLKTHKPKDFVNALENIPKNTRLMYVHSYQSFIWNKMVSQRINKYGLDLMDGDLIVENLTDSDLENRLKKEPRIYRNTETQNDLTIFNVVMPLPGHNVIYPENEIHSWYQEALSDDGFDIDNMKQKIKTYSICGSYRPILVHPHDLTWSIRSYDDVMKSLISSDLDLLSNNIPDPTNSKDGDLKALIMQFSLPPSSYATMALREIIQQES